MKPQVSCTSLLAWLDDSCLAVSIQGGPLMVLRRCEGKLRLAGELREGASEEQRESGELQAGKRGIRGLALLPCGACSRPDGISCMLLCDSSGRVQCRQAGHISSKG